jgi:5'-nucleotidase (lipoprotein e(P4) family)
MNAKRAARQSSGWMIGVLLGASLSIGPALAQEPPQNDLLNATLWMQNAVEYKANSLAVFTLARLRLEQALADPNWTAAPAEQTGAYQALPPAIVVDVDETIMDNSPYEVWLTLQDKNFDPRTWTAFVNSATSRAIPGALEFIRYAQSRGVKTFYVTNRTIEEEAGTRKNLELLGFPLDPATDTVLTTRERADWGSAKGTRRSFIAKDFRILLNLGDNLGDFTDDYRGDESQRDRVFEANKERWGREWIVIANPAYGSFESAPYKHDFKQADGDKRRAKRNSLQSWPGP